MPVLTQSPTLGDLLKYELSAAYNRETVTLKSGTSYPLGAVLGKITASGKYRLSPAATVTGDEGAETAHRGPAPAGRCHRRRPDRARRRPRARPRVQGGPGLRRQRRPAGREDRQARAAGRRRDRPARDRLSHLTSSPGRPTHDRDAQPVRRRRLRPGRDDPGHQPPAQRLHPARPAGPVPLRGCDPAQRGDRAGRGRPQPAADRAAGRPAHRRQPRRAGDALVHRALDPARRRHHAAGHPGRARLRRRRCRRPAGDDHGAQAHPHAGQARPDPRVHGGQRPARHRQGRCRHHALQLPDRVRPRPAGGRSRARHRRAPTSRPRSARCSGSSRPSSRARP